MVYITFLIFYILKFEVDHKFILLFYYFNYSIIIIFLLAWRGGHRESMYIVWSSEIVEGRWAGTLCGGVSGWNPWGCFSRIICWCGRIVCVISIRVVVYLWDYSLVRCESCSICCCDSSEMFSAMREVLWWLSQKAVFRQGCYFNFNLSLKFSRAS